MTRPLHIGTRGSKLALWQASTVRDRLEKIGVASEIHVISTTGDRRQDVPLSAIGGKGLFIKEIEEALRAGEIDLAVHSLKDVPSIVPEGFCLAGYLERADARDAWIHPENIPVARLERGAVIGTSSPRRRAQIRALFPHLEVRDIRGNVDTRISKARDGSYAGVILAAAGLERLGRISDATSFFGTDEILPAAGQGIVTIETMSERDDVRRVAASITHEPTATVARCERGLLERFDDRMDCHTSIAAHATLSDSRLELRVFVSDPAGSRAIRAAASGTTSGMDVLITEVANRLFDQGALELIQTGATA